MAGIVLESQTGDLLFSFSGYDRGRRPLQWNLSSGHKAGAVHEPLCISSLTSDLMRVQGRTRVYNSKGLVGEKSFEVSITDSQELRIDHKHGGGLHPSDKELERHFVAKDSLTITASDLREFTKSPLETISFQIVVGDIRTEDGGMKSAFFCRGHIHAAESTPTPPGEDITVEHVLDSITFLSADLNISGTLERALVHNTDDDGRGTSTGTGSKGTGKESETDESFPGVRVGITTLAAAALVLVSPFGARGQDIYLLQLTRSFLLYILRSTAFQIALILVVLLIALVIVITPKRRDYPNQWLSRVFRRFARPIDGGDQGSFKTDGKLSMFINGWNAWSFCGSIPKGTPFPLYGMPHKFVKAFHDGGPALNINLGRTENTARDYIASDMYTVIADTVHRRGIVCGFLSQKQQFGCISANKSYDHMTVHIACDGAVISPRVKSAVSPSSLSQAVALSPANIIVGSSSSSSSEPHIVKTDWLFVQLEEKLEADPLSTYLQLSGLYHRVPELFASDLTPNPAPRRDAGGVRSDASSTSSLPLQSQQSESTSHEDSSLASSNKMPQPPPHIPHTRSGSNGSSIEEVDDYGFEDKGYWAARGVNFGDAKKSSVANNIPAGWCSWYHFFEKVSEEDLEKNIDSMRTIKNEHSLNKSRQGFALFQIDDGYQRAWGDWLLLDEKKFPKQSMRYLVDRIRGANMKPGLWMAPFACDKHSKIAARHKDWILKKDGTDGIIPANSANCGKWFYGLDVTNPQVRLRVHQCIRAATQKWGFEYLKLDFLYAAALGRAHESYHDRTLSRAQAMQIGMHTITEAMGESVFLLGCGAPMGSVIGHVHANRVSADAGLSWYPPFPLPPHDKWNLPCARNMVRNSICRMTMHGRWWINDPDCMLLRTSTSFTEDEIIGIATVKALSGGSFIISDDLNTVPAKRIRIAQQLLPASNKAAIPLDLLDREMPEILRLSLGTTTSSSGSGSKGHSATAGGATAGGGGVLEPWTVLGVCNWDDYTKRKSVTVEETDLLSLLALRSNTAATAAAAASKKLQAKPKPTASSDATRSSSSNDNHTDNHHLSSEGSFSTFASSIFSFILPATPTSSSTATKPKRDFKIEVAPCTPVTSPYPSVLLHSYEFWSGTYSYHIVPVPVGTVAGTAADARAGADASSSLAVLLTPRSSRKFSTSNYTTPAAPARGPPRGKPSPTRGEHSPTRGEHSSSLVSEDSHFLTPSPNNAGSYDTATNDSLDSTETSSILPKKNNNNLASVPVDATTTTKNMVIGKLPKIKPHSALLYSLRPLTFISARPAAGTPQTTNKIIIDVPASAGAVGDAKISYQPRLICEPQYLGSNLHFSSGLEVKSFSYSLSDTSYGTALNQSSSLKLTTTAGEQSVPPSPSAPPLSVRDASRRNILENQSSSLIISFHDGAIRGSDWGGYIVLFLPLFPEDIPEGAEPYVSKDIHEQITVDIEGSVCKQRLPRLITLIDEPQSGAKGSVWKIYVRATTSTSTAGLKSKDEDGDTDGAANGGDDNKLIVRW